GGTGRSDATAATAGPGPAARPEPPNKPGFYPPRTRPRAPRSRCDRPQPRAPPASAAHRARAAHRAAAAAALAKRPQAAPAGAPPRRTGRPPPPTAVPPPLHHYQAGPARPGPLWPAGLAFPRSAG